MFKLIVAGTRTFNNYELLERKLNTLLKLHAPEDIEIVSGGAKGADALGEKYARSYGMKLKIFPADWNKYGRAAGPIRNEEMAKYADACVVFWDGKSRGAKSMIELAKERHCDLRVVRYE